MQAYDSLSTFPDVEPALKKLSVNEQISCVVFCEWPSECIVDARDYPSIVRIFWADASQQLTAPRRWYRSL